MKTIKKQYNLIFVFFLIFSVFVNGEKLYLNFQDIELKEILNILSEIAKVNIVYPEDIIGKKVNIKLDNIDWENALKIILENAGYDYQWDKEIKNLIKVKRKTGVKMKEENIITKTYIFKNLKAKDIIQLPSLKEYLSENGSLMLDEEINAINIRDFESNVLRIEQFLQRMDNGQVLTKIIFLRFAKAEEIVSSGVLQKMISKEGFLKAEKRTNSLVITDTETNIKDIEEFVKKIDIPRKQVMIEVTVIETNRDYFKELGINWKIQRIKGENMIMMNIGKDIRSPDDKKSGLDTDTLNTYFARSLNFLDIAYLNQDDFLGLLTLLETKTDTKIIYNQRIATLDNQKAVFKATKELPVRTVTYGSGGVPTVTVNYIYVGLNLEVIPTISPENDIGLEINPSVSDTLGTDQTTGAPIISKTSASTNVLVKSGQTVVIGGLQKERNPQTESGIPKIKDIPILGWLFKKKTTGPYEKRELLIFITAKIISESELEVTTPITK